MKDYYVIIKYVTLFIVTFYPVLRILGRAGLSKKLSLLLLIPYLGFYLILFILAYSTWPLIEERRKI